LLVTIEFQANIVFILLMLRLLLGCSTNNTNNIQEGFMIVRHILFAGLCAAATCAQAGTVEASASAVQPAWSLSASLGGSAGPTASQSMIAGPGTWSAHSRLGDVGSSKTMLFSQTGPAFAAPVQLAAPQPEPVSAAAPAAAQNDAAPVTFTETAQIVAEAAVSAPAPAEIAAIVVNADIVSAAPAALAAVPEPATGMLMLAGLLGAGLLRRRQQ
jgi:hypothetical protein